MVLGGAEMMLFKLLANMDRARFDNTVVSMMPLGPIGESVAALGLPVHVLGIERGKPGLGSLIRLIRCLRSVKPDVLQTWMANADLAGFVAGKMVGVPTIIWNVRDSIISTADCSRMTLRVKRLCARLSQWPTLVISNSEAGKKAHIDLGYHPREWRVIANGFDLSEFAPDPVARHSIRQELGIQETTPLIGIVGRDHPMKDHASFILAAERLHKVRPDVHFAMIGSGLTLSNKRLVSLAPQVVTSNVFHMLGPRRDIARLLAGLDLFTLTSSGGEGFPNVVGEAMACQVPCIVTKAAGDAPIIVGNAGIVVPAGDPAAIDAAWERVLGMPQAERAIWGSRARQQIEAHYNISDVVCKYENLYATYGRGECPDGENEKGKRP